MCWRGVDELSAKACPPTKTVAASRIPAKRLDLVVDPVLEQRWAEPARPGADAHREEPWVAAAV
jgi:hypothetical protein